MFQELFIQYRNRLQYFEVRTHLFELIKKEVNNEEVAIEIYLHNLNLL
jgi:hypothetical protein